MIFKADDRGSYTVADNGFIRDKGLSLKAKGLLLLILSLPSDWQVNARGLAKMSADGVSTVRAALHELEQKGYAVKSQDRMGGKFSGGAYTVYEIPRSTFLNAVELEENELPR